MKKDKGNAGIAEMIEVIVVSFVLFTALVIISSYGNQLIYHSKAETIARNSIALMEVSGGLTSELEEEIRNELEQAGLTDIDLTGSTNAEVKNGNPIILQISANINRKIFDFDRTISEDKTQDILIVKSSISKIYD